MSNCKNIFKKMKLGEEIRQDDPQYSIFMDAVSRTLKLSAALNASENVGQVRERLSEIIGIPIDDSSTIFASLGLKTIFIPHYLRLFTSLT